MKRAGLWQPQPGVPGSCVPHTILSSEHPTNQVTSDTSGEEGETETSMLATEWALGICQTFVSQSKRRQTLL